VIMCFALTGILTLLIAQKYVIIATLVIWALATIPQTAVAVAFSVVMNAVAGPDGRYALLSRRWAIFGVTGVVGTFIVTRVIDLTVFPLNYAIMFLVLSVGGFVSFYFSNQIRVADQTPPTTLGDPSTNGLGDYLTLLKENPIFVSFVSKRFIYFSALILVQPIMPLYLVRAVHATDSQIGTVTMLTTMVMLVGYFLWPWLTRRRGSRFVLLASTFGMIFYPALSAATTNINWIILYSAIAGLFQAGIDLVFFDELMRTFPIEYSAMFVSLAQSTQYISMILAPMLGTWLANYIGLGGALWLSAGLSFIGFLLFIKRGPRLSA